ncbi:MAG: TetR/AcrR family transcriptional regulator [Myxococcota bacterium]
MPTPRKQRTQDDGLQARDRLLEAGTRLFSERGYAATSVGAICESAGVGKPALYWHFESKEGLLVAVLEALNARWIDEITKQTAVVADPEHRLQRLIAGLRRLAVEEPQLLRLPTLAALEQATASDAIRSGVLSIWDQGSRAICRGTAAVTGAPEERYEPMAFVVLGLLSSAAVRYSIDGDLDRLDRNLAAMERAVRALVGAVPEASK